MCRHRRTPIVYFSPRQTCYAAGPTEGQHSDSVIVLQTRPAQRFKGFSQPEAFAL